MIETKKDTENTRKRTIKLFIGVFLLDRAPYTISLRMQKIVRQSVNTRSVSPITLPDFLVMLLKTKIVGLIF